MAAVPANDVSGKSPTGTPDAIGDYEILEELGRGVRGDGGFRPRRSPFFSQSFS